VPGPEPVPQPTPEPEPAPTTPAPAAAAAPATPVDPSPAAPTTVAPTPAPRGDATTQGVATDDPVGPVTPDIPVPGRAAPTPPPAPADLTELDDAPLIGDSDAPFAVSVGTSHDPLLGMSTLAADAYVRAAAWAADLHPACRIDAAYVAGVSEVDRDRSGIRAVGDEHDAARAAASRLCSLAADLRSDTGGALATQAAQHRVAFALAAGDPAAEYLVHPQDATSADEFADEVVRFAAEVRGPLTEFAEVVEDADPRVARVVTWLREQIMIGAKYAATNPGRFGTPWDGRPKRSFHSRRMYQYPQGTITYDCSGLVVVAFRQIGVDLIARDATWTGTMLANLPRVARDQAAIADLLIFGDGARTTHVAVYLGGDRYVHAGSCGGEMAVCEREGIAWGRVMGVVRVPLG
jgi:cell wall-associated NlpC family hydrolase